MANSCGPTEEGAALDIKEGIFPVSSLPNQDILQLLGRFVSTWTSRLFIKLQMAWMEPPALGCCCWVPRPLHLSTTIRALLELRSNQEFHFPAALRPPLQNYLPSSVTINRKIRKPALDSLEKLLFSAIEREEKVASHCQLPPAPPPGLGTFPSHLQETLPHPAQGWKRLEKL